MNIENRKQVCFELSPSPLNVTLSAFAAKHQRRAAYSMTHAARPQLSNDISCPHDAQQQTRRPPLLLSSDGTDRQTDGRTDGRPTVGTLVRILWAASVMLSDYCHPVSTSYLMGRTLFVPKGGGGRDGSGGHASLPLAIT